MYLRSVILLCLNKETLRYWKNTIITTIAFLHLFGLLQTLPRLKPLSIVSNHPKLSIIKRFKILEDENAKMFFTIFERIVYAWPEDERMARLAPISQGKALGIYSALPQTEYTMTRSNKCSFIVVQWLIYKIAHHFLYTGTCHFKASMVL